MRNSLMAKMTNLSLVGRILLSLVVLDGGSARNTPPVIINDMNGFQIPENTAPGSKVYNLSATDAETEIYYGIDRTDIFYADPVTGEITLLRALDYETSPVLNFVTVFEDLPINGSEANTIIRNATVYVTDVDENVPPEDRVEGTQFEAAFLDSSISSTLSPFPLPPAFPATNSEALSSYLQFDQSIGIVEIMENWPVNIPLPFRPRLINKTNRTVSLTIEVSHPDLNGAFALESSTPSGNSSIKIVPMRADILDRERFPDGITLQIIASNQDVSAVLPLTIRLLDVNDNAPVFQNSTYNAVVSYDADDDQPVLMVQAADRDSGFYGVEGFSYSILGQWARFFRLVVDRSDTVEVRTAVSKSLARNGELKVWHDVPENFVLVLRATDANGTGLYTDAPISIRLVRMEKHPPSLVHELYFARLQERNYELVPPLVIEAYDEDDSILEFSLADTSGVFGIEPHTGIIYVQNPNDATVEKLGRRYQMTASVSDGVHERISVVVTVEIIVLNEKSSNMPPKFKTPTDSLFVPAGASDGFVLGNIMAEDPEGSPVKYYIVGGGDGQFTLNQGTGELAYTGTRLINNRTFVLTVVASDQGHPPAFATATLRVNGAGLDSVEPKFTEAVYATHISENVPIDTELIRVGVMDPDANGLLSLITKRTVAFDSQGYPILTAADGTDLSSYFSFRESGIILRKSLYDSGLSAIHIDLTVSDDFHPLERPATCFIILNIIPVTKSHLKNLEFLGIPASGQNESVEVEVTVPWELKAGGFIYQFHVVEKQASPGSAGKPPRVVFTVIGDNEFYTINETTGVVVAKKGLASTSQRSTLVVEALNPKSGQTRMAKLTVQVMKRVHRVITMENSRYDVLISEDAERGTFVLKANVTAIVDPAIRYSLTGRDAGLFSIDTEGMVTLNASLDREKLDVLAFNVGAVLLAENGSVDSTAAAPVVVTLLDVNDNAPSFENANYNGVVLEDAPSNTNIMTILANDPDAGENGTVAYRLENVPEEIEGSLSIDSQRGTILNVRSLLGHAGIYNFTAIARDRSGLGIAVPVSLTVLHVSSCQPSWSQSQENITTLEIDENMPPGQLVGHVRAVFQGQKCKVKYNFLESSTGQAVSFTNEFSLDTDSGRITTKVALDREKRASYALTMTARDVEITNGFAIQRELRIIVKDVNDNEPVFQSLSSGTFDCDNRTSRVDCWTDQDRQVYNFTLLENEPSGTEVAVLVAYDADEGDNAKVYYHLAGGNDASHFDLDAVNGTLSTKESFDYETRKSLSFYVIATNEPRLSPARRASLLANTSAVNVVLVVVTIIDQNDNAPVFDKRVYLAAVFNDTAPDSLVATVHAVDPDTVGGGVYYRISRITYHYKGSEIAEKTIFSMDSVKGEIRTSKELGEYSQGHFELNIESSNARNYTTNVNDTTIVKVWIYTTEQLVRIVMQQPPSNITDRAAQAAQQLGDAIGADVISQRVEYHRNSLGVVTNDKADILAVFIDRSSSEIIGTDRVLAVVDRHGLLLTAATRPDLGVAQILPAYGVKLDTSPRISAAAIAVIVFGCVMFIGLLGVLLLLCHYRYKAIKDSKQVVVRRPESMKIQRTLYIPTRQPKGNPLWDDLDQKPYEEQELSIPMPSEDHSRHCSNSSETTDEKPSYAQIKKHPASGTQHQPDSVEDYYQTVRMN